MKGCIVCGSAAKRRKKRTERRYWVSCKTCDSHILSISLKFVRICWCLSCKEFGPHAVRRSEDVISTECLSCGEVWDQYQNKAIGGAA